jgi:hypothetical protein
MERVDDPTKRSVHDYGPDSRMSPSMTIQDNTQESMTTAGRMRYREPQQGSVGYNGQVSAECGPRVTSRRNVLRVSTQQVA